MDALDILTNVNKVKPYFQAIVSADEQTVIGYEVLGRIETETGMMSLGSFFHDYTVPDEYRLEVDETIQQQALQYMLERNEPSILLFLNCNAMILMKDRGQRFLTLLEQYVEAGLSFKQIVIEITEHDYEGDMIQLNHLLTYFRTLGIKIAVDDVGKGASNLDRIGLLSPDILKVDLSYLITENDLKSYSNVLFSLSMFARKIGTILLYEGVEDEHHLHYAWRNGGNYYQGYLFGKPEKDFIEKDRYKEFLKNEFHQFIAHEKNKLETQFQFAAKLNAQLTSLLKQMKETTSFDKLLISLSKEMNDVAFRMYICDQDGFQKSSNIVKQENGTWALQEEYKEKNWSWRPYFLENITRMNYRQTGILSDLYRDIEKSELIRTFSFPLENHHYLFIDIPHLFLYEHDGLLD